jgi:CSLREA domain-containing protein
MLARYLHRRPSLSSALARFLRPPPRQRPLRRRPRLEALEDRMEPAVITVTTVADNSTVDGLVSLREAIVAANTDTGTALGTSRFLSETQDVPNAPPGATTPTRPGS